MKKLLKPANICFYILMLLVCFSVGLFVAGAIGAGKNQGLAGGAIVVGYGFIFGVLGFIASFFIAFAVNIKSIIKMNWVLLIILICTFGFTYYKFSHRDKLQNEESDKFKPAPTAPAKNKISMVAYQTSEKPVSPQQSTEAFMEIGFFKPNYCEYPGLYFYGGVNPAKEPMEHTPMDSVVFTKNQYNNPTTTYAPPWPDVC